MTPEQHIAKAVDETTAALADGLDVGDVALLIKNGIEIADKLDDIPGPEKRSMALAYASELLDVFWDKATPAMREGVAALDIPYVPEGVEVAVIDPLVAAYMPTLLKHFVKLALPSIVDLVIQASKGGVQVNTELWTKAGTVLDLIVDHGEEIEYALKKGGHGTSATFAALEALRALRE